jgi:hypothetical protein
MMYIRPRERLRHDDPATIDSSRPSGPGHHHPATCRVATARNSRPMDHVRVMLHPGAHVPQWLTSATSAVRPYMRTWTENNAVRP